VQIGNEEEGKETNEMQRKNKQTSRKGRGEGEEGKTNSSRSKIDPTSVNVGFGEEFGTGTGFTQSSPAFPCQYHSTNAPYSFIHLPSTLYNIFLPALQFPL